MKAGDWTPEAHDWSGNAIGIIDLGPEANEVIRGHPRRFQVIGYERMLGREPDGQWFFNGVDDDPVRAPLLFMDRVPGETLLQAHIRLNDYMEGKAR